MFLITWLIIHRPALKQTLIWFEHMPFVEEKVPGNTFYPKTLIKIDLFNWKYNDALIVHMSSLQYSDTEESNPILGLIWIGDINVTIISSRIRCSRNLFVIDVLIAEWETWLGRWRDFLRQQKMIEMRLVCIGSVLLGQRIKFKD